ncbi:hypothetical protein GWI33_015849 [Rhynchophorus ferrugineus]|uniref:Cytochrome b-c1 complex subunit Rieske, mitochondrial n=1 Tax=Rhynchophorus ferrugineus TaxID=354439 RepID=A0A834HZZ3_RHYFE|nr:hypothetical protein GWI33_015849 [Rhynchophorus ferrugineus]
MWSRKTPPYMSLVSRRVKNLFVGGYLGSRNSHTDLRVPDFSKHMRKSVEESHANASESADGRRLCTYMLTGMYLTAGLYGAKSEITRFATYMWASADVLAMAKIEIKLNDIPEDKHVTFKWRGKPLFVWHRKDEDIEKVRSIPISTLRDPEEDAKRVKDPKWLVVLGVCTHLGCVPLSHQGDFGGYYCPCHGSHFDISGRARKGPAPSNLVVPPYSIVGDTLIVG